MSIVRYRCKQCGDRFEVDLKWFRFYMGPAGIDAPEDYVRRCAERSLLYGHILSQLCGTSRLEELTRIRIEALDDLRKTLARERAARRTASAEALQRLEDRAI